MSSHGHSISIAPAEIRVEIVVDGVTVADTTRPVLLDETGLPTRYYVPREDVDFDLLVGSPSATTCPFKGAAKYWSAVVNGTTHADLVWTYEDPIPDAAAIQGLLCFYNERVDIVLDGEPQTRPETPYSK